MKKLNEITIADLMPDSISGDAQVSATARAIDPQLRLISEAVDRPLILAAIDDLSAEVLEHLAVQYDVTAWDSAWPIETKRAVLKTAIADKRKKGTRGAVERAIEAVALIATLTEWWQDTSGDMPPHTFKIDLLQDGSAVDPETQANVIAQVEEAKPVRSHYAFRVGQLLGGDLYFAGVLRAISYARVRSAGISIEQTNIDAGVLAALRGMSIRRLLASSHMGEMPEPTPATPAYYILTSTTEVQGPPLGETHLVLIKSARGSRSLSIAQGGAARVLDVYVPPIVVTLTAQCSYADASSGRAFTELDGSTINQYAGYRWDAPVMYNGERLKASRIVDQTQFQIISTSGRPLYRYSMSNIPSQAVPYYCFADNDGYLVLTGGGAFDYSLTINNITITQ